MFQDRARIVVQAGRGGDGALSFRREKHVPKGGPDGGDGGRGGDVVVLADPALRDLSALRRIRWLQAGRGGNGRGTRKHGADGEPVEIRVPVPAAGSGAAYLKFPHPASRFAVVGVAAAVTLDKQGACTSASVGVTGAGTKAVRAKGVEAALKGKKLDAAAIEAAAQKAAEGVDVQADLQGSVEYKSHLCRVFAKRAITEAVKRAGG